MLLWFASLAWGWPADTEWVVLERDDLPVVDVSTDGDGGALEIVGTEEAPAFLWWVDQSSVFVRIRLASEPLVVGEGVWGVVAEVDANLSTVEAGFVYDASTETLFTLVNATGAARLQPATWDATSVTGEVRSQSDGDAVWLDIAVLRSDLAAVGLDDTARINWTAVTGLSLVADWTDESSCDSNQSCSAPRRSYTDLITVDGDEDGLPSPAEYALGLPHGDADADDDGVLDGLEVVSFTDLGPDLDGDGNPAVLDCDSDGDGLPDGLELGVDAQTPDTLLGCFRPDLEPSSTTDPQLADTDGGGLLDGEEDVNQDGVVGPWETDPLNPADDQDTDGDGIPDGVELRAPDGNIDDVDSDGDGLSDASEGLGDPDGDGLPSFVDDDSDGDGLLDSEEGPDGTDTDGDGLFDALDTDSDADGVLDAVEGDGDPDGDGLPSFRDDDADGDGVLDVVEGVGDADCDDLINTLDADDLDGPCGAPADDGRSVDTAGFSGPPLTGPGDFTGGGCRHGGGLALWPAALLLLAVRRRRWLLLGLLSGSASAQEVDALRFAPASPASAWVLLTDVLAEPGASVGVWTAVTDDPLVFRYADEQLGELAVLHRVTTALVVGELRGDRIRLNASLPAHVVGEAVGRERWLVSGDVRLTGAWRLVKGDDYGVEAGLTAVLPTGDETIWLGTARAGARGFVAGVLRRDRLGLAGRVTLRSGPGVDLGDLHLGPTAGVAGGLSLAGPAGLSASVEAESRRWIGNAGEPGVMPTVARLSGGWQRGALSARVFAGMGLSAGLGAPDWQAGLGVALTRPAQ